jgi:hypothetical protein
VELVSLVDPASCVRGLTRVPGALVVWDDGTVPDLSPLSALRTVGGPLVLFGVGGQSNISSLAPLANLEARWARLRTQDGLPRTPAGGALLPTAVRQTSPIRRLPVATPHLACELPPLPPAPERSAARVHPPPQSVGGLALAHINNLPSLAGLSNLATIGMDLVGGRARASALPRTHLRLPQPQGQRAAPGVTQWGPALGARGATQLIGALSNPIRRRR